MSPTCFPNKNPDPTLALSHSLCLTISPSYPLSVLTPTLSFSLSLHTLSLSLSLTFNHPSPARDSHHRPTDLAARPCCLRPRCLPAANSHRSPAQPNRTRPVFPAAPPLTRSSTALVPPLSLCPHPLEPNPGPPFPQQRPRSPAPPPSVSRPQTLGQPSYRHPPHHLRRPRKTPTAGSHRPTLFTAALARPTPATLSRPSCPRRSHRPPPSFMHGQPRRHPTKPPSAPSHPRSALAASRPKSPPSLITLFPVDSAATPDPASGLGLAPDSVRRTEALADPKPSP